MFYQVKVYVVEKDQLSKPKYLSEIIVEKKLLYAKEVMTGFGVPYINKEYFDEENRLKEEYIDEEKLNNYGFQLFTDEMNYNEKTEINEEMLDEYFQNFNDNEALKYIEKMRKGEVKEKMKVRRNQYE